MGEEKAIDPKDGGEDLNDLDSAFDEALAILSDANAKVTEVLETMDNPDAISVGTEVDEDGNIHEGDEMPDAEAEPEAADA